MKTASVQHLDTLAHNSYTIDQIDFRPLTNIYSSIMKKLTNVSPFLLLLVPIFMMMILTLAGNGQTQKENTAALKSGTTVNIAKLPAVN
jgi:hypothetical protein